MRLCGLDSVGCIYDSQSCCSIHHGKVTSQWIGKKGTHHRIQNWIPLNVLQLGRQIYNVIYEQCICIWFYFILHYFTPLIIWAILCRVLAAAAKISGQDNGGILQWCWNPRECLNRRWWLVPCGEDCFGCCYEILGLSVIGFWFIGFLLVFLQHYCCCFFYQFCGFGWPMRFCVLFCRCSQLWLL